MRAREQLIVDVEKRFWDAMKHKDARAAGKMTDDGCIIVGAQGVSAIDGKAMSKLTTEGKWELKEYAFDEAHTQIRFIGDEIAIIGYKVTEKIVVDGETLSIEANDASVWIRREGEWCCALHSESLAGDQYGR